MTAADELLASLGCSWDDFDPAGSFGPWLVEACQRHNVGHVVATPGSSDPFDTITAALERREQGR